MVNMVLGQAVRDIGIGAGGVTMVGVISLLIKRGITGTFSIGGGNSKLDISKFVTAAACEKKHKEEKEQREQESVRQQQRHDDIKEDVREIKSAVDVGFRGLHERIDRLYQSGGNVRT